MRGAIWEGSFRIPPISSPPTFDRRSFSDDEEEDFYREEIAFPRMRTGN